VLLVDTGNVFSSPYLFRKSIKTDLYLARVYKEWDYQAVALGWGDYRALREGVGTDLPWVSANVKALSVEPFRLMSLKGWKVAVVGVTGKGSFESPLDWNNPVSSLKEAIDSLHPSSYSLVVLLCSSPVRESGFSLVKVGLILGGVHGRGRDRWEGSPLIFWLKRPKGAQVGEVVLEWEGTGVKLVSHRFYTLDSKVPGDTRVEGEVKGF